MDMTEAARAALLEAAVQALTAHLACGPETAADTAAALRRTAASAVTAAVVRGHHIHTLIAAKARCSGLTALGYITDVPAHSRALCIERNAANNYLRQIADAARSDAVGRFGREGYGAATKIAEDHGISRKTLYTWLEQSDVSLAAERDAYFDAFSAIATQLNSRPVAMRWFRLDIGSCQVEPAIAAAWANAGFLPREALPLIQAGVTPSQVLAEEQERADTGV